MASASATTSDGEANTMSQATTATYGLRAASSAVYRPGSAPRTLNASHTSWMRYCGNSACRKARRSGSFVVITRSSATGPRRSTSRQISGRPANGTVALLCPMRLLSPPAWMTTVTRGRTKRCSTKSARPAMSSSANAGTWYSSAAWRASSMSVTTATVSDVGSLFDMSA